MSARRQLHFNAFMRPVTIHTDAWRYPGAWPDLWRNLSYGYEVGQQSDMLFSARFEDILHLPPAQAREALGWRGHRGPVDSREASLIFGEGREIIP